MKSVELFAGAGGLAMGVGLAGLGQVGVRYPQRERALGLSTGR
jgi:hypothetical protein